MSQYIIKGNHITKKYKNREVVSAVNIHIKKGEIYGLVGPNGAGKSTTLKMLLNLTKPDSGEFLIGDTVIKKDSYSVLNRMGSIIENPYFYEKLTGRENLELHCEYMGYHNLDEIDKVLKLVSLNTSTIEDKTVSQYSVGMKQRLAIARAILGRPEILILDEPINGLDPDGIIEIRNLIRGLNRDLGMTVVISSHILSEIELLADTIGIMKDGKLLVEAPMKEIHEQSASYIEIEVDNVEKAGYVLDEVLKIRNFLIISDGIIRIFDLSKSGMEIGNAFATNGIGIEKIQKKENSLEEYFFKMIKGGEGIASFDEIRI